MSVHDLGSRPCKARSMVLALSLKVMWRKVLEYITLDLFGD